MGLILPAQAQDTSPFTSENVDTRRNAVIDLRQAPSADQIAALPALIEILKSEKDGQVRLATFDVLTDLGPAAAPALDALVHTLQSNYGGQDKEELHQDYRAALALAAIGEPAVAGLQALLGEKKVNVQAEATMALGRIGSAAAPAVPNLVSQLVETTSDRIRLESAIALGRIGTPALTALIDASARDKPEVRAAAVAALGPLIATSPEAQHAVRARIADDSPAVRAAAVEALASLTDADADLTDILASALADPDESVRRAAVTILVDPIRRPLLDALSPRLDPLLTHTDPAVTRDAAFLIHRLGPAAATPRLINALRAGDPQIDPIADALTLLGPSIGDALTTALHDPEPRVRRAAALALGAIRPLVPDTVENLASALTDTDPQVQSSVLTAIGRLGPRARDAVPAVRSLLDQADDNPALRIQAIDVLAHAAPRDEALVITLSTRLDDPDAGVQRQAIETLAALGPLARSALPTIIARLQDENTPEELRLAAAEFLAGHGPAASEAVPVLITFLDEDDKPTLREAALAALASLGRAAQPAFEPLTALLKSTDPALREASITTLASLDLDADALRPHLAPRLMDEAPEVRRAVGRAIFRLGPRARIFLPDMILAAQNPDNREGVDRMLRRYERNGPDPASIPELTTQLQHDNETVRLLAAKFLGLAGPAAADSLPTLERLRADDPSEAVRKQAESACEQILKPNPPPSSDG